MRKIFDDLTIVNAKDAGFRCRYQDLLLILPVTGIVTTYFSLGVCLDETNKMIFVISC